MEETADMDNDHSTGARSEPKLPGGAEVVRGACPKCYSQNTTNYSAATGKITRIWRCKDCDHRFTLISKKDWDNRGRETWRLRRPGEGR